MDINKVVEDLIRSANEFASLIEQPNPNQTELLSISESMSSNVISMDEWLSRKGFLPERWEK